MLTTPSDTLRFMIVDDEMIIALDLEAMLEDLGHTVVETVSRVDRGMELAKTSDIDMAILDINVRGQPSFPIAQILRDRSVPFIFSSGYGEGGLIDGFRDELVLTKPYDTEGLRRILQIRHSSTA
jgi:two-component SAPR family response regulator